MDRIEDNVKRLLNGDALKESQEFCDFTLEAQNEATVAKGVAPAAPSDYIPQLNKNVCYIVAAVLINDSGEVLMMQEAKRSCAGQWYLPAGHIEAGETIQQAVEREVLEETGLTMQSTTLIMVQSAEGCWVRFVFTGNAAGRLKTPAEADSESLQAKWISDINELSLRASDVEPLVACGRQYWRAIKEKQQWHPEILPVARHHTKLLLRLLICVRKKDTNRVHILLSEKTEAHIPTCEINPRRSLHSTLKKYMMEIFGAELPQHRPHGVLSVEHSPTRNVEVEGDGFCLTLLISIRQPLEEVGLIDKYTWLEVNPNLEELILPRMAKNMTTILHVIR
ncbi:8-oxo-dGDP phosphatase NUDT18-like [Neocloeon triangulifer]|uniref:8-oxo-dGDP phosphatase NUDT18-like n=1 Tax=Neocloeon triangulifer TaxID=2078957 RepID=UPI00286F941B|nr:8-oxo-dGDP phosphatase NUDT18-like [Neocloeon triangulifer]XP_059490132.1 8-oxo-dGDP phosphatase NUDT18-like [Neocloeon triangulifer]